MPSQHTVLGDNLREKRIKLGMDQTQCTTFINQGADCPMSVRSLKKVEQGEEFSPRSRVRKLVASFLARVYIVERHPDGSLTITEK